MKFRYVIPAMAAVVALALTGCSNDDAAVKEDAPTSIMSIDDIREAGVLVVATDAEYPPNEFKDEEGNPTGWAVELTEALAAEMGLEVEWQIMGFDAILPRIEEGVVNVGSSSFTDNKERQEVVDFVDYLNAGSQWAAAKGSDVDPDNACGLTVAVQTGTIQVQELQERSEQCEGEGNDPIDIFSRIPRVRSILLWCRGRLRRSPLICRLPLTRSMPPMERWSLSGRCSMRLRMVSRCRRIRALPRRCRKRCRRSSMMAPTSTS